jgi:UDPglucose 6-dehydrogenase
MGEVTQNAQLLFCAVDTPPTYSGDADLSRVEAVVADLGESRDHALVMKSTVPVGTGASIQRRFGGLGYISNPEFLKEGTAVADFMKPDRVVIGAGAGSDDFAERVEALYAPLDAPVIRTDVASAEMIKLASNAFLATKISFINEIANVSEELGADVNEVARGMGLDARIGPQFLRAGIGYGGSCFPKDVRALIKTAQDYDVPMRILEAVESVNDTRKRAMARKVAAAFSGVLRGKTVAVLGLTFKPNTDDMREAPSIPLIVALQDMGAKVRVHDPEGMQQARQVLTDVTYCDGPYDCIDEADAAVIVTEWEQFRALDFDRLKDLMACPVIVDLRNIYRPEDMQRQGFAYTCVGRSSAFQPAAVYVPATQLGRSSAESPA